MMTAMKRTTGILAIAFTMAAGAAFAQNPDAIDNARSVAKSLQQKQANDTNAALDAAGVTDSSKPAPGAPAPAVKPAVIPGSQPKPAPAPSAAAPKTSPEKVSTVKVSAAPKASSASSTHNQLQKVNVVHDANSIEVVLNSSEEVTPRITKLSSPARLLIELPETSAAVSQNHIPVGDAGVKGVRIGMDGKTPPTTSVVVDLEKALTYDLTPGPAEKLILTLHTQEGTQTEAKAITKATVTTAKATSQPATQSAKATVTTAVAKSTPQLVKTVASAPQTPAPQPQTKTVAAKSSAPSPMSAKPAAKPAEKTTAKESANDVRTTTVAAASARPSASEVSKIGENAKPKQEDKKWAMNGKRDPFFSPVVQQNGSGCSTGKKCLEIGAINLRGVVKSDAGFIAVVTNNLNKAYFLRENDPVFNGYVVRITGDSVVFQETVQDKLGKSFTREVVKRIFTPAV
jgi:Tfp pilus assembly protein PilP